MAEETLGPEETVDADAAVGPVPAAPSGKDGRQRAPKSWRLGIIGAIVLAMTGFAMWVMYNANRDPVGAAGYIPATEVRTTPGGDPSSQYRETLRKAQEAEVQKALQSGDSYIPEPVRNADDGVKALLPNKEEEQERPAPVRSAPRRPASPQGPDLSLVPPLKEMLKAWGMPAPHAVQVYEVAAEDGGEPDEAPPAASGDLPEEARPPEGIHPGDMFYAMGELRLNSDYPKSPAVATVVAGRWRGTRFIGGFERFEDRLIVRYTTMVLPDGTSWPVEAFAVDPDIPAADVASRVDHHYLSRWGGLLAAGFLEGVMEAANSSKGSTTTVTSNGTPVVSEEGLSKEKQVAIVAGKIGERFSSIAEQNFNRPPTVELDAQPIGVLLVSLGGDGERRVASPANQIGGEK